MSELPPFKPSNHVEFAGKVVVAIISDALAHFPVKMSLPLKAIADQIGLKYDNTQERTTFQSINGIHFQRYCNDVADWLTAEGFMIKAHDKDAWTLSSKGLRHREITFIADPA